MNGKENIAATPAANTNLPKGYKRTEIGVIPEDWEIKILGDIANFTNGQAHEQFIENDAKYIVINSKFVSSQGKIFKTSSVNLCPLKRGDIAMVMSDIPNGKALAKCFVVPRDNKYTLNQRICALRSVSVDNIFLSLIINRNKYYLSFDSGTGQTNLKKSDVLGCPIPIPQTIEEQKAIATVLSDTDKLIQALEKKIAKKQLIKKGAMQQLLKPKEGWKVKKLGEILIYEQPTKYIVSNTEYNENYDIPVLTAGKSFILGYTNERHGVFANYPVIIFDDFTTDSKYINFSFKVKSSAIKLLKPKHKNINLRIIFEIMQQIVFPLGDHKRHWISEFQPLKISIPESKQEQTRIAQILSDMDNEIEALKKKLAKYKKIKQGMMQVLLTGKIRLV
jgi:type I restriction enzyme S subunit